MAGLPTKTRKQQVLERLEQRRNFWVDANDLANPDVGGLEGLRRVRELVAAGHPIIKRRHPDKEKRSVFQYSLQGESVPSLQAVPQSLFNRTPVGTMSWVQQWHCETCGGQPSERPQILPGGIGLAKCGTCRARRYFRAAEAVAVAR